MNDLVVNMAIDQSFNAHVQPFLSPVALSVEGEGEVIIRREPLLF